MQEIIFQYYAWLSSLTNWMVLPLSDLAEAINLPLVSALFFGLIGATAPCQLSTNAVALAFVSRKAAQPGKIWGQMAAFIAGKITVYSLVGGAMVLLGLGIYQINDTAIPIVVFARKALGPLLILVGLFMAGVLNLPGSMGGRLAGWFEAKARGKQGLLPAYLLGWPFLSPFARRYFGYFLA